MWFKTRAGLVHIDGTAEFMVDRFTRSGGVKSVGVVALKQYHAQFVLKRLFRPPLEISHRRIYLACFPDNEDADRALAKCMVRIESAVIEENLVCDLSDLGQEDDWGPGNMPFIRWPKP